MDAQSEEPTLTIQQPIAETQVTDEVIQTVEAVVEHMGSDRIMIPGIVATLSIFLAVIITRLVAVRFIRGNAEFLNDNQRRWLNRANNAATTILLCGLFFVWTPQIQSFALSLTAVAVAIVISTKEIIMCLTGGIYRATTNSFEVGDWITIGSITGEVMQISALSTHIQEVDTRFKSYEFTGRSISIPNSTFLTANVENAHFTKEYTFYEFSIVVPHTQSDPCKMVGTLKDLLEAELADDVKKAKEFIHHVERKTSINFPDPAPKVSIRTTDVGNHQYTAQIFVKTQSAVQKGAEVTQKFLDSVMPTKPVSLS